MLGAAALSKNARKRANRKARDLAEAEAAQPVQPVVNQAVSKPKPKDVQTQSQSDTPGNFAQDPAAQKLAKVPAQAKLHATSESKRDSIDNHASASKISALTKPKEETKNTAPGGAGSKVSKNPAAQAKGTDPKIDAKAVPKQKVTNPSAAKKMEQAMPLASNEEIDDGTGGAWEVVNIQAKKNEKRRQEKENTNPQGQNESQQDAASTDKVKVLVQQQAAKVKGSGKGLSVDAAAAVSAALADVARITESKAPAVEKAVKPDEKSVTLTIPEDKVGLVIGPKGSKIRMIQEKCGVKIDTISGIGVFTVSGDIQSVDCAEAAIKELAEKGYCSMSYDDFSEDFVNVHPMYFPEIIGPRGRMIREMKEKLNVEISLPEVPKSSPANKKFKVNLAGNAKDVEVAKNVIFDIIMYGHHEITHPDDVHEELEVEESSYRHIIGRAGSEMKHIKNNWKVNVIIPKEHSANSKVVIVGSRENVDAAKVYIEKKIYEEPAEKNKKAIADKWDVDENEREYEPWEKQYMLN